MEGVKEESGAASGLGSGTTTSRGAVERLPGPARLREPPGGAMLPEGTLSSS